MSGTDERESQRDMNISTFGEILKGLCGKFSQVETAVLYDALGETIDYCSYKDPFATRLTAAYHGLIFETTRERCKWLEMGAVDMIEIFSTDHDSVTIGIGEGLCLTIIASPGAIDSKLSASLEEVKLLLREEAGF
jgi:predicted regulator of Ras-like GTPase activity (Roadblock/LC7/MglB family)